MKKTFITVLVILLLILAGCGAKEKMEEKLTEKIMETTLGADVDIDGEEVTFEGEDGAVTFGSSEWPDSELAKKIPEFKDGNITSVVNSEAYVFIVMEEANEDDFKSYYETVKSEYSTEAYESKYEGVIAYSGSDAEGVSIIVSYSISDKTLSIQASMPEKTE